MSLDPKSNRRPIGSNLKASKPITQMEPVVDEWLKNPPKYLSDSEMVRGRRILHRLYDLRSQYPDHEDRKAIQSLIKRMNLEMVKARLESPR